ncbi:hypothetical protein PUNSTDRAFT_55444 [Punctularia strigosozonata HHB-11173 SS5]|uniref:Alpha/beta-hydrolase n=1 Tax=Punctularia strigosozonata (strain HHB-11173) TaxID=741275 RepID=R7S3J4_PUNST|nr:uncharacterized protein PUNSTDRAFT_55444 [Punctularia strigosozonata HHB-11173 SS5]EIN04768.1 hypothetical protein PUNSTDRAFT_55444 [Punctularia strigosozonata HHB-11173 SS5]
MGKLDELLPASAGSTTRQSAVQPHRKILACLLALLLLFWTTTRDLIADTLKCVHGGRRTPDRGVIWVSCGDGFQCANISVPLDYHNGSDPRTMSIAVTQHLATDSENRQGAIFINPGGPGGSGTSMTYRRGPYFNKILKGQYDIIGFDPRGINQTRPYLSCFETKLDADVYSAVYDRNLNLPINQTLLADANEDLSKQVARFSAATASLAQRCAERTGEYIPYLGTEAVVRDIDYLSRIIEGEEKRVNFWGFSYGTVIGQYLVKILPPSRIGRVIIDGVVNPVVWSDYPALAFHEGLDDVDNVFASFARSCSGAGDACALSHLAPTEIVSATDALIDDLYLKPRPVFGLGQPAIATAQNVRDIVFRSVYSITSWPDLAVHLSEAFQGNFTGLVNVTMPKVDREGGSQPDDSRFVTYPIWCADTKAYDEHRAAPSDAEIVDLTLGTLERYSRRNGDGFFKLAFCHHWDAAGVAPRRSRYNGTFDMEDDTLDTPILILSNTYDPVTSLASARAANARLGNNARLVQQADGWGHCTTSQTSFCTAQKVRDYFVNGVPPSDNHTICRVDQRPFEPWNQSFALPVAGADNSASTGPAADLMEAWAGLVRVQQDEQRL